MSVARCLVLLAALVTAAAGQEPAEKPKPDQPPAKPEDYKVYTERPRLLINSRRLRLIRRERERKTLRWESFNALIAGKAPMPEPGFAYSLHYLASEDKASAKQAIAWAVSPAATDVRQLAIVFDWCQPELSESQLKALTAKLTAGLDRVGKLATVSAQRDRVLAAAALSDAVPEVPERHLKDVFENWWMGKIAPAILKNRNAFARVDGYPLMELMHVIQDNLKYDMRDNARLFFRDFPLHRVISYYPAAYPAADAVYHVPQYTGLGEPDVTDAALSRAADLAIVAYDTNALEHQFLQGWLIQDRYIMRSPFGAPYEFLWANPYQPGLSYHHLPPFFHDPTSGTLFLRSNWEEDATWLAYQAGNMELFMDGKRSGLQPRAIEEPLAIGDHVVMMGKPEMKWTLNLPSATRYFLIGLKPNTRYDLEVDDQELTEAKTDTGGILALTFQQSENLGVHLKVSPGQ